MEKIFKYKFSNNSLEKLKGVDRRLVILVTTYLNLGKKDIGITYGVRTLEEQKQLLKEGKTRTLKSKHLLVEEQLRTPSGYKAEILEGNALDFVVFENGRAIWEREAYKEVIEDMKKIANHFGWKDIINFGWDFKTLDDPYHISVKEDGDGGVK